ncbi:phage holin family protein [uncultured Clostridium sp.]|jgi:toxin secretion/phage lysis holin|uniref:phage holin family protein n=1 Tax=uncultured Clostridium sp. TaxID=59620 RepID=UPI002605A34B|nr:phage holin family protein [uncultured Clostridium sp.]
MNLSDVYQQITMEVLYYIFTILVVFDVATGMGKAWKYGRLKSRTLRDGLFGSMAEILSLILCMLATKLVPPTNFIVFAILIYMILKELTSVVENLIEMGAKLPSWLIKGLQINTDKLNDMNLADLLVKEIDKEEVKK